MFSLSLLFLALLILSVSCYQAAGGGEADTLSELVNENPVTVTVPKGSIEEVESYSTNVVTYVGIDREPGGIAENGRFRLSVKEIAGNICTRIDYPGSATHDGIPRSSLLNGEEVFLFKTATEELEQRIPVPAVEEDPLGEGIGMRMGIVGRIQDFPALRTRLHNVSTDIFEDQNNGILTAVIPYEGLQRFSLKFDTAKETLIETEIVEVEEDGTVVTTSLRNMYKEVNGVPVKVGEISEAHYDVPGTIDTSDYALPIIEDEDEIPVITQEQFEELKEQVVVHEVPLTLGDPSNPDYTETRITLYKDLELNSVDDSLMRVRW